MRRLSAATILVGTLLFVPTAAYAQAVLAGVVHDTSGAVLPGVTVEASSPVLIEKSRTAVTERSGVEVSGSGVIAINVDLKVGAVAETITVSGETPVVDTQSARHQSVLSNDTISTLPATRTYGALLAAVPGLQVQGNGTAAITPFMAMFTANG